MYIWLGVIQYSSGSAASALMLPPVGVRSPIENSSFVMWMICCFASASVRIVQAPPRSTRPGRASTGEASFTTGVPLTNTWTIPSARCSRRRWPFGQVVDHLRLPHGDALRVEEHEIGRAPGCEPAAALQAIALGGHRRHEAHGLFERQASELTHPVAEEIAREALVAERVDVRTRIREGEEAGVVAQQPGDRVFVAVHHDDTPLPGQVVLEHQLAEGVERLPPASFRDLRYAPVLPSLGRRRRRDAEHEAIPGGREPRDERAELVELRAEGGIGERPAPLVARACHEGAPERHLLQEEGRLREVEAHFEWAAADLGHHLEAARLELCRLIEHLHRAIGNVRIVEERRPGDEFAARPRQLGERLLLPRLLRRRPDRRARRDLDHAAVETGERRGKGEELLLVGDPTRRGRAIAEEVRRRERRRPADGTRVHRRAHERGHGGALFGRRGAFDRGRPHHAVADGGVTDEGGHVRPDAAPLERGEVATEVLPCPLDAGAQRLERHTLDEEQQLHQRFTVRRTARRDREAAVPHDDRGDAVPGRGAGAGVPEELAVVVRVDVDEAGGKDQACAVDLTARRAPRRDRRR